MGITSLFRSVAGTSTDPPAPAESPALARHVHFDVLASKRRELLVEYLDANGGDLLSRLAPAIAALQYGVDPDELTAAQEKRVYVSLQQTHVPKLDGLDVVDVDEDPYFVAPGPNLDEVARTLDAASGRVEGPG